MAKILKGLGAAILATIALTAGLYQLMNSRTFQILGELVYWVPTTERVVALTFDDGPTPKATREILDVLDKHDVVATFFLVGESIDANPTTASSIVESGHEVGNHSYTHPRMIFMSPSDVAEQVEKTNQSIRNLGVGGEIFFRPPHGKKLFSLPFYLWRNDITSISWDIAPETHPRAASSSDEIVLRVSNQVRPGSIILLHVMRDRKMSRAAVEPIITRLKEDGYRFVTVSELLATRR